MTVSIDGAVEPIWGRNGELFYRDPVTHAMMAVAVSTEPALAVGVPEQLFEGQAYVGQSESGSPSAVYDVTEDGQRFLMAHDASTEGAAANPAQMIIVQNWHQELLERVPVD